VSSYSSRWNPRTSGEDRHRECLAPVGTRVRPNPSQVAIPLPGFIQFTRGEEPWPKHLYADPAGSIPLDFTSSWEADTLREELANPEVVAWLRNVPNED
jgi:hypothetical protein